MIGQAADRAALTHYSQGNASAVPGRLPPGHTKVKLTRTLPVSGCPTTPNSRFLVNIVTVATTPAECPCFAQKLRRGKRVSRVGKCPLTSAFDVRSSAFDVRLGSGYAGSGVAGEKRTATGRRPSRRLQVGATRRDVFTSRTQCGVRAGSHPRARSNPSRRS